MDLQKFKKYHDVKFYTEQCIEIIKYIIKEYDKNYSDITNINFKYGKYEYKEHKESIVIQVILNDKIILESYIGKYNSKDEKLVKILEKVLIILKIKYLYNKVYFMDDLSFKEEYNKCINIIDNDIELKQNSNLQLKKIRILKNNTISDILIINIIYRDLNTSALTNFDIALLPYCDFSNNDDINFIIKLIMFKYNKLYKWR